ncbi:MAG: hypothetical protein ACKOQ4_08100 [Mycobacterium sp.]
MPAAARSYVSTGVALAGAFAVTAAQLAPPVHQAETRAVQAAVSLTAAGQACSGYHTDGCDIWAKQTYTAVALNQNAMSAANIAANILTAVASIPRAVVDGLNDLSYALEQTGSWWVYTSTNALGFDPADPLKVAALVNLAIPFKALSHPLGDQLSWWARANLPTNPGCTGNVGPTCEDFGAILNVMFKAPFRTLASGYTFPTIYDPISEEEAAIGEEIPGSTGAELPWSGAYVKMNLADSFNSVANYLNADPALNTPERVTGAEVRAALARLGAASKLGFYPFVPKSFLLKGWPYTALTPLFTPFIKQLCPTCDPANPGGPGLTEVTPPAAATPPATLVGASAAEADPAPAAALAAAPAADAKPAKDDAPAGLAKSRKKARAAAVAALAPKSAAKTPTAGNQRRAAQRAARAAAAAAKDAGAGAQTGSQAESQAAD